MNNIPWFAISNYIHIAEEWRPPMPSSKLLLLSTFVGIPVAVLLHDTSDFWLPRSTNIPILSWFIRKWKSDPEAKEKHLRIFRNAIIFAWFVAVMHEVDPKEIPLDYVSDRITSSDARANINKEIHKSRSVAFTAAAEVMGENAFDVAKSQQQRDAALRRRSAQESRNTLHILICGSLMFTLQRSVNTSVALSETAVTVVGGGEAVANAVVYFDGEVLVHSRQLEREEVCQPLGILVSVGKGGSSGISKCVTVRLTDPKDNFFLFSMCLLEDDYGRFKEKYEINADFGGFPRYVEGMIKEIACGNSHSHIEFVVDSAQTGTLRIKEKTEFRFLDHLTLQLSRQGDVGQKKYLAERFNFFQAAFVKLKAERDEDTTKYERVIYELRTELSSAIKERDELRDRLKLEATSSVSAQLAAMSALKDQHSAEIKSLQTAADAERVTLNRKIESIQSNAATDRQHREGENHALRERLGMLETSEVNLRNQLRTALENIKALQETAETLKKDNNELTAYRHATTKILSENELTAVSTSERLKHLNETLRNRDEEVKQLREQQSKHDSYAKMLAEQLSNAQEKIKTTETSLAKAHHILGTQVQAIRATKDKYSSLRAQLDANETLLGEKNNLIERLRGDAMMSSEKIEHMQSKVTELKEQLMRSEEQNNRLASQLKQNEDALIHMQRMSTGFGTRTFSAAASNQLSSFNSGTLYKQFSTGAVYSDSIVRAVDIGSTPGATKSTQETSSSEIASSEVAPQGGNTESSSIHSKPTSSSIRSHNILTQYNSITGAMRSATAPYANILNNCSSVAYLPPHSKTVLASNITEKPSAYFNS